MKEVFGFATGDNKGWACLFSNGYFHFVPEGENNIFASLKQVLTR